MKVAQACEHVWLFLRQIGALTGIRLEIVKFVFNGHPIAVVAAGYWVIWRAKR